MAERGGGGDAGYVCCLREDVLLGDREPRWMMGNWTLVIKRFWGTLQRIHIVGGSILTKLHSWSKLADIT